MKEREMAPDGLLLKVVVGGANIRVTKYQVTGRDKRRLKSSNINF